MLLIKCFYFLKFKLRHLYFPQPIHLLVIVIASVTIVQGFVLLLLLLCLYKRCAQWCGYFYSFYTNVMRVLSLYLF